MALGPKGFVGSLRAVAAKGSLTPGDLSVWFARPRATIYSWLHGGHYPLDDAVFRECVRRLALLKASGAFPVPYEVTKRQRRTYISGAFADADHAGVSKSNSPRGRALLRGGDR